MNNAGVRKVELHIVNKPHCFRSECHVKVLVSLAAWTPISEGVFPAHPNMIIPVERMNAFNDRDSMFITVAGRLAFAAMNGFRIVRLKLAGTIKTVRMILVVHHRDVVKGFRCAGFTG